MRSYHEQDFYELLELTPEATQQEIETAYQRLKGVFGASSSATFMLFGEEEAASMRERLDEAYETLSDHSARVAYDVRLGIKRERPLVESESTSSTTHMVADDEVLSDASGAVDESEAPPQSAAALERTFDEPLAKEGQLKESLLPSGVPAAQASAPPTPPPLPTQIADRVAERPASSLMVESPPTDTVTENMEYGGAVLARIREGRNITLEAIAQRTKISLTHLRAIEANRYDKLPARVYVRGFVSQYAKFLQLPADRVADSYLQIYDRFFQNKV